MVKKGNYTCRYCSKKYKRGKYNTCCNQCAQTKDYCLTDGCNNNSILLDGYTMKGYPKFPGKFSGLTVLLGDVKDKAFNFCIDNNKEGEWLFNHCPSCFEKVIGVEEQDHKLAIKMLDMTLEEQMNADSENQWRNRNA